MEQVVHGTGVVVIVEDEPMIGRVLRTVLRDIAPMYEVVFAQHGYGAIVQVESRFVSLAIVDYHIPDMNGFDVTREIKARSPQTYVLAISGDIRDAIRDGFYAAGADDFLSKPMAIPAVVESVVRALGSNAPKTRTTPS